MSLALNPPTKCACAFILLAKSFLWPTKKITNVNEVIVIVNGKVDNGFKTPNRGYNSFISNPVNIKNAILKLTENKNVSMIFFSLSLRTRRMTNPGMNVI